MKAYVINLDKDRSRLSSSREIANRLGLEIERIPAVDGALLPKNPFLSAGEAGCIRSHVLALETFLESGDVQGLIFEDDISCNQSRQEFDLQMELVTKYLPLIDIVYLGKCYCDCGTFKRIEKNLYYAKGALCLHAYLVSWSGAQKLLNLAVQRPLRDPIDVIYYDASITKNIKSAVLHPSLFKQDANHLSNLRSSKSAQRAIDTECAGPKDLVPWHWVVRRARGYLSIYWGVSVIMLIVFFLSISFFKSFF